jgi:hypothetical protein
MAVLPLQRWYLFSDEFDAFSRSLGRIADRSDESRR